VDSKFQMSAIIAHTQAMQDAPPSSSVLTHTQILNPTSKSAFVRDEYGSAEERAAAERSNLAAVDALDSVSAFSMVPLVLADLQVQLAAHAAVAAVPDASEEDAAVIVARKGVLDKMVAVATELQQLSEQFQALPHSATATALPLSAAQPAAGADSVASGERDAASDGNNSSIIISSSTADASLNSKAHLHKTHEYLHKIRMVAAAAVSKQQQGTKRKASAIAIAPAPMPTASAN